MTTARLTEQLAAEAQLWTGIGPNGLDYLGELLREAAQAISAALTRAEQAEKALAEKALTERREGEPDWDRIYCPACGSCGIMDCCPAPKCIHKESNQKQYDDLSKECDELYDRAEAAEAARARLLPYVQHKRECYIATNENGEYINCYRPLGGCDCGLDEALK